MLKTIGVLFTSFTCASSRFPKFEFFLEFIEDFRFSNSFGTLFPKGHALKHNALVSCWQGLIECSFNKLFLRKLC